MDRLAIIKSVVSLLPKGEIVNIWDRLNGNNLIHAQYVNIKGDIITIRLPYDYKNIPHWSSYTVKNEYVYVKIDLLFYDVDHPAVNAALSL